MHWGLSSSPLLPAPCNLPLAGLSLFLSSRMPTWPLVEQIRMPAGAREVHTMGTPVGLWLGQNHVFTSLILRPPLRDLLAEGSAPWMKGPLEGYLMTLSSLILCCRDLSGLFSAVHLLEYSSYKQTASRV